MRAGSGPRRELAAAAAAGLVAAVIILASSRGDFDRMTYGDGLIYRYVAAHLSQDPADVDPVVRERGTSLRYGRVGLAAAIWVGAAGQPRAMPYVQPVLIALSAAAAGGAAATLLPRLGMLGGLTPFLAPGFAVSVAGGFAEVLAVALALWAVVCARAGRWGATAILLAAAMLTRENAGAVLVGIVLWLALRRRWTAAGIICLSIVPLVAWYAYVAARYGHIPILDPYLRVRTDTIGPPILAIWRALTQTKASSAITAAAHLAVAILAFTMWRRSLVGAVAAASGLQVLAAGRFSFAFEGEAIRQFTFLQLFVLIGLLSMPAARGREAAPAPAPGS